MKLKSVICLVIFPFIFGASTSSRTLEQGAAVVTPATERKALAYALDSRIVDQNIRIRPVIGTGYRLSSDEQMVVSNFIELMPNSSFIVGGRPNYILVIDKRSDRAFQSNSTFVGRDQRIVTYSLELRSVANRTTFAISSQSGRCIDSEALSTFPTRCSILEPLLLQRAIEKL